MLNVSVESIGTATFYKRLRKLGTLGMKDIAEITRKKMIKVIDQSRQRPKKTPSQRYQGQYTKHLQDVLTVVPMNKGRTVGIGNRTLMDIETPYWKLINDGGMLSQHGTTGKFTPSGAFKFDKAGHKMVPQAMVRPMHYIEKTTAWVALRLRKFMNDEVDSVLDTSNTGSKVIVKLK